MSSHRYLVLMAVPLIALIATLLVAATPNRRGVAAGQQNAGAMTTKQSSPILVAPAVTVSQAYRSRPHWEVLIAADPTDTKRLIACSKLLSNDQTYRATWPDNVIVYMSTNGGANWQPTLEIDKHQHNNDPACAFGPDGSAYFMSFGGNRGSKFQMPMYRSLDGAKRWNEVGEAENSDRPYITVDDTNGKYRGRVYVHSVSSVAGIDGAHLQGLAIFHSTDQGQTYKSVKLADEETQYVIGNGNGVVMSDGTFAFIFGDASGQTGIFMRDMHPASPNLKLKVVSSNDGGETFEKAKLIDDWYYRFNGTLDGMPSLAVDRTKGPFHDRLYASWVDVRAGRGEIRLARSDDKGKTWFPSIIVSDNWPQDEKGESPDAFMPEVAVNRNGILGVMWYDRRDHPDNQGYDIRFTASLDGGESFLPSVLVSRGGDSALRMKELLLWPTWNLAPKPDGRQHAAFSAWGQNGGDTAGLACDLDGVFHPLWIDRLSGIEQVSTTRITVNSAAMPNGGEGLESLSDFSAKAEIHYSMAHVDLATNEITIRAAISNISKAQLPGRLTLRLLALSSSNGLVEVQNSDNRDPAAGAIWEFRTSSGEPLQPGAVTLPRQLRFAFVHAPFDPPRLRLPFPLRRDLVEIDTKILGR
jgi:hypothetical protein